MFHEMEVEDVASLYEAAVRGLAVLREHPWCGPQLGLDTIIEVRAVVPSLDRVLVSRLLQWLDGRTIDAADQ